MKTTLLTVKERRIQQRTGSFAKLTHKRVAKQQHINGFLFAPIQEVINDGSVNRARTIAKLVDHLRADTDRSNKLTLLWVVASKDAKTLTWSTKSQQLPGEVKRMKG